MRSNLRWARRILRFHSPAGFWGASYQQSPTMTSSLPSLLTSATPTPSERKLLSRTIFFQEIVIGPPGFLSGTPASNRVCDQASKRTGTSQQQCFMDYPRGGDWRQRIRSRRFQWQGLNPIQEISSWDYG